MKKILIIAGGAFLGSVAVGTALGVVLAPKKPDAPAAAVDGSPAAETPPGAGHGTAPAATERGAPPTEAPASVPAMSHAMPGESPAETAAPATDSEVPQVVGVEFDELSNILSTLPPRQAALFLDQLDNNLALSILRSMTVARAARILMYCDDVKYAWFKEHLLDPVEPGR